MEPLLLLTDRLFFSILSPHLDIRFDGLAALTHSAKAGINHVTCLKKNSRLWRNS